MAEACRAQVGAIVGDVEQAKKVAETRSPDQQRYMVKSILWSMTRAGNAEGALAWLKTAKLADRVRQEGPAEVARLLADPDGFR